MKGGIRRMRGGKRRDKKEEGIHHVNMKNNKRVVTKKRK